MATFEDVRRYQLHLAASGVSVPTINQTVSTLRFFFFRITLRRHEIVEHTHVDHEPRKLPVVPSVEEVARLLAAAPDVAAGYLSSDLAKEAKRVPHSKP
jgi:site-specific recombinase XerD